MNRGRRIASGLLGLALLGLAPASAQAALLDANCSVPTNAGFSGSEAQTFTAVHTGTLVRGEMFVAKTAGADFQMQILNAGPSGPTGGALGTTTIPDSSIANVPSPGPTSPSAPVDGTFSPGVSVTAGQQYAIVVTRIAGSFVAKDNNTNPCPGNEFSGTVGGTWTLINPSYDFPFSTYVNPTNAFTIGKVKGKKVLLNLPGPGAVDIAGVGTGGIHPVKPSHVDVGPGPAVVVIRLTKPGKLRLHRQGKLKVTARFTYTPTGGEPNSVTSKLKLRGK